MENITQSKGFVIKVKWSGYRDGFVREVADAFAFTPHSNEATVFPTELDAKVAKTYILDSDMPEIVPV